MFSRLGIFSSTLLFLVFFGKVLNRSVEKINNRPIIGIIAEESNPTFLKYGSSSIFSSYVKFVESAGARVVPIMVNKPEEYYKKIFSKINGVLLPGGGIDLSSKGYGRTGRILYDLAVKANDKDDYFPLLGICLGFELLNYLAANDTLWMKACDAEDIATTLNFTPAYKTSRMFQNANTLLLNIMQTERVTINYHQWCLTSQNYSTSGLNKFFRILSFSENSKHMEFISIIEAEKYPFYGVAFHPEKILFEWVDREKHQNIPHTNDAILTSQYFANFFVNEARKSNHKFLNKDEEDAALIYNYNPVFTGKKNFTVQQIYFFP